MIHGNRLERLLRDLSVVSPAWKAAGGVRKHPGAEAGSCPPQPLQGKTGGFFEPSSCVQNVEKLRQKLKTVFRNISVESMASFPRTTPVSPLSWSSSNSTHFQFRTHLPHLLELAACGE